LLNQNFFSYSCIVSEKNIFLLKILFIKLKLIIILKASWNKKKHKSKTSMQICKKYKNNKCEKVYVRNLQ
jgi:hypothetical protein